MSAVGTGFFARLKQRKLVQWAIAYVAFCFALIQALDVVADSYDWPHLVMHLVFGVLALGFVVMLVLAWYHGERGAQRVSGPELLLIALVLAIGGGLLWHFGGPGAPTGSAKLTAKHGPARSSLAPANGAATPGSAASQAAASAVPVLAIAAKPVPAKSIAVLPFENLSADKDNAYFADGIQDLILTKLADIGELKVIARTSTEQYGSHPDSLARIGEQLGVATFLEGSVQKAGKEVLINVQLIDASTQAHIWAQSYTRTLTNVFGVESEVADKVAKALNAELTQAEAAQVAAIPTTNAAAYDAFLRGEYHMTNFNRGLMKPAVVTAVAEYSEAVQRDPKFALAWARLANAQTFLGGMTNDDPALRTKLRGQARLSIAKATALQPDLAEAWVSQGIYDYFVGGDWRAALDAFRKAHALQPQDAGASWWVAYTLIALGEARDAIQVLQRLQAIDPKRALPMLGGAQADLHHFADATQTLQRALALDPDSWNTLDLLADLYAYLGDLPGMGKLIENAPAGIKTNPNFTDTVGQYLFYRRDWSSARKLYARAREPQNLHAAFYPIEVKRGDVEWYADNKTAAARQYQLAIPLLRAQLQQQQDSVRWRAELGWVYARLGRDKEALQLGTLRLGTPDPAPEAIRHSQRQALKLAGIEAQVGKTADAVAILDTLLAQPTGWRISVPLLQMDPVRDPIRKDPRFQALLKKYARDMPVVMPPPAAGGNSPAVATSPPP